jgi:hypothetical protein
MQRFTSAIYKALENENWYGALFLALTLPDICGKIQYPQAKSEERYVKWFQKYLDDKYTREVGPKRQKHIFLSGEDCYALRCSLLHEGSDAISSQRCKKALDSFLFLTKGAHCNWCNVNKHTFLELNVTNFCEDICEAVEKWLNDLEHDDHIQKELANIITIFESDLP